MKLSTVARTHEGGAGEVLRTGEIIIQKNLPKLYLNEKKSSKNDLKQNKKTKT